MLVRIAVIALISIDIIGISYTISICDKLKYCNV